jgi:hypothetical protein
MLDDCLLSCVQVSIAVRTACVKLVNKLVGGIHLGSLGCAFERLAPGMPKDKSELYMAMRAQ